MPPSWKSKSSGRSSPLILTLAVVVIWCAATGRWDVAAWQTPIAVHGDPLEVYARVQAASEDPVAALGGFRRLTRLGAPYSADWTLYPASDRIVFAVVGLLTRGLGLFAAINLAVAVGHVLNALAFYACGRWLRWRPEWAAALALLFTFANYNFRWGITLSFSLTFFVPPLLLLCGWVGRDAPAGRTRGAAWLAGMLGLWLGGANPYFGFFSGLLAGGAFLLQWLRRRAPGRLRAAGVFLAALLASFALNNAPYFVRSLTTGSPVPLERNYAGAEIYGLKLIDLLVPPAEHRIEAFAAIGRLYHRASVLRGEFFVNYLGVIALAAFALTVAGWVRRFVRRPRVRLPDAFLGVGWTVVFSTVGGINSVLALAGLDLFRATSRYSVFLLAWALFLAGGWCQRHGRNLRRGTTILLAAALAAVGLLDSLPVLSVDRLLADNRRELQGDREIVRDLESRIGTGARVFQLPAAPFPEAGAIGGMGDYEHFRPYLATGNLRFSYGGLRNDDSAHWSRWIADLPPAFMVAELESAGFGALWIDRRGASAATGELIRHLQAAGYEELASPPDAPVAVFLLHPQAHPVTAGPDDPRLLNPWNRPWRPGSPYMVADLGGWYGLENSGGHEWRWARRQATMGLWLAPSAPVARISFAAVGIHRETLELRCNGRPIWSATVGPDAIEVRDLVIPPDGGLNRLSWHFAGRPHRVLHDDRRLGFSVRDFQVEAGEPGVAPRPTGGGGKRRRPRFKRAFVPRRESNFPKPTSRPVATMPVPPPSERGKTSRQAVRGV